MPPTKLRAAVSFTGGKDCHLAWHKAAQSHYEICCLVIFHPPNPHFRAHPLEWQEQQAQAAGIPLRKYVIDVQGDQNHHAYHKAYAAAISKLQSDMGVQVLVSGDIDLVGPTATRNFLTEVCETYVPTVQVILPLWQGDRATLLHEMLTTVGLDIRFTCVKSSHFDASWIGRQLTQRVVDEDFPTKKGLDWTGENGEYHSMVLGGPMYGDTRLELVDVKAIELTAQNGQPTEEQWWVCDTTQTRLAIQTKMSG